MGVLDNFDSGILISRSGIESEFNSREKVRNREKRVKVTWSCNQYRES